MKKDEYNVEKIVNEGENLDFEYGNTQGEESTSYLDNDDRLKDEINDNPVDNGTKRPKKEKKKRRQRSSKKETNQSPEGSISSATATVATVVGAALISVTTLSALVGINLFFNAKCKMNKVEPTINSIVYELDLTDIKDDQCIITLENQDYSESQELIEGINTGEFIDLVSSTEYHISVIDISYNNYVLFEDDVITKDEDVPAINTYTVTFVTDGGSEIPSQVVNHGDTVVKPDDPTKENYSFMGWFTDSNLTSEYDFSVPVLSDLYLYAKWEELPKVTINFEANGGTGEMETDYQYLGKEYILPECALTAPNGYVFGYWQIASGDSQYEAGEGYLIQTTASVTFIAVWLEAATVEFYPGIGATGSVTSIKVAIGKEYEIPSGEEYFIPPTNQEFDYWFDDMYSEQRHAGDVITIEDTYYSFTAHWKYLDGLTFTVTFDSNGGSEVESQVVNAGTNATKPDDPTKDDYIFEGWYSNSELTNLYNFITPVTEDITLYAKWSTTYSVSGEGFNGFPNSTVNYATESEINGVNLQVSAYSCYFNDPDDGHGLWIPLGYDSQSPEDCISYLANKTPINGSIKNIAITVGPSAYGGTSNTTLHVTFGTEPMLEHLTSGTTITYDTDATLVVECNLDGFSYFNITNVSENGLVIESIVVTYYVN